MPPLLPADTTTPAPLPYQELQGDVTDEVRAHLASLRERLMNHITETLGGAAAARAAAAAAAAPMPSGGWRRVREAFLRLFAGGTSVREGSSKDVLSNLLIELHEDITAQVGGWCGAVRCGVVWCGGAAVCQDTWCWWGRAGWHVSRHVHAVTSVWCWWRCCQAWRLCK